MQIAIHDDFKDVIRECFDSYSENLEDKTSVLTHGNYTGQVLVQSIQ
jgi:hypothetical protein